MQNVEVCAHTKALRRRLSNNETPMPAACLSMHAHLRRQTAKLRKAQALGAGAPTHRRRCDVTRLFCVSGADCATV
jgi:hypothetical protein